VRQRQSPSSHLPVKIITTQLTQAFRGYFNIPNAPFFEEDGTWLIEGYGIDPDIEVVNDPSKLVAGIEPQLDAAIKQMMYELKTKPFVKARKPAVSRDRRRGIVTQSEK